MTNSEAPQFQEAESAVASLKSLLNRLSKECVTQSPSGGITQPTGRIYSLQLSTALSLLFICEESLSNKVGLVK